MLIISYIYGEVAPHLEESSLTKCNHDNVSCINPYEYIRKYKCELCGEVMMCSCDEEFGRRFLPHQLSYGTELMTRQQLPVTIGFQKEICNKCRGEPEEAHPRAEIYGCTTKIRRYYWREIECETIKRFAKWSEKQGYSDWLRASSKEKDIYKSIENQVISEVKDMHQRAPKYEFKEESRNDIIINNEVKIINLNGVHIKGKSRGVKILDGVALCSPEEFAANYFERLGYNAMYLESSPFHAMFAIIMFPLIQDPIDPNTRVCGFGDREAFDLGIKGECVYTSLPDDFGTPGYALRREREIGEFLDILPHKDDILQLFDQWVGFSTGLRQYLWAHRMEHVNKARILIEVLPNDAIKRILRYLVKDYWRNYLGWPDLLLYKDDEFFLAEIKSSTDKLSEDQKKWIKGNYRELNLPFELVKIHRAKDGNNSKTNGSSS